MGVSENMDEQLSRNELDLLELKTTSRNHILYGLLLLLVIPCCLFLFVYTLSGYFVIFIVVTPSLGLWFLYDGIHGYKQYKKIKEEFEPTWKKNL